MINADTLAQHYAATGQSAPQIQTGKAKVGGIKGVLANLLPLIGGTVGAVGGSFAAPVVGTAAGGAAGSALGEFARQKLLGEKTNFGSIAGQGALGALPGVGKIIGKGAQALKAGTGARALAEAGAASNVAKTAESAAAQKALQGSESMAAATKAASVPSVSKPLSVTTMPKPLETVPGRTIVNPTVGEVKSVANTGYGGKLGALTTDGKGTPFVQGNKVPVVKGTATDIVNPPLKVEAPTQAPALKVEAPANPASDPYVRIVNKDGSVTHVPASMAPKAPTASVAPEQIAPAAVSEPLPAQPATKLEKFAQGRDQANRNTFIKKAGTPTKGGDYLTFDKQQKIDQYVQSKGIKAGTPEKVAKQVEANHAAVTQNLDNQVNAINRPLTPAERQNIVAEYEKGLANSSATDRKAAQTYIDRINDPTKVKDIKDLEALRKEADAAAYTDRGAGNTSKAIQAEKARKAIDAFVTPLSPELKAAKGEYMLSKQAAEQTAKASNTTQGIRLFGMPVATQETAGAMAKGNAAAAKVARSVDKLANGVNAGSSEAGAAKTMTNQGFMPYVKAGVKQELSRAIAGPMLPDSMQQSPQAQADTAAATQYEPPKPDGSTTPTVDNGPFSDPQKVQQAYMAALADGNTKAASMILDGYKLFGPSANGGNKAVSTTAATAIANANAGIQSIDILLQQLKDNPSAQAKSVIPGQTAFGGAGARILGTAQYDAALQQAKDIVQRLRTGAAISTSEEGFYNAMMPQAFDNPATVAQKLTTLRTMFQGVAERQSTGVANDQTNNADVAAQLANLGAQ